MTDIVKILEQELGPDIVLTGNAVRQRATSYWDSTPMSAKAVVRARTTQNIADTLRLCHAAGQSVITHGGRTGCVEGTHSSEDDIVISLERLTKVMDIDPMSATVTVEAGAILEQVQNTVAEKGLFLPLDLGARGSCTIGGNLSTNAGGINVIRYGMARSLVLGLEAVLPDGTIISSMNKMLKNNAGYDLKQLFIGTEGTLGVITRAVLRLHPCSTTKNTALAALPDFDAIPKLLNHLKSTVGTNLSAFEAMWGDYFRAVTEPGWHSAPMDRTYPYYILFECDGSDPDRDNSRFMEVIEQAFVAGYILDAIIPKSEAERRAVWAIRDDFEAVLTPKPVYLYDVSLPIASMENYVADAVAQLKTSLPDSRAYVLGHIADGNLHFFVQPGSVQKDSRILSDKGIYEPLKKYGGSVSAEHGIGHEKKKWLSQCRNADEIALMQLLKRSIDPKNILNPGVVID